MIDENPRVSELEREVEEQRRQLQEAQDTLDAIRNGQVDALVTKGPAGNQVFTLESADRPYRLFIEEMQQGAVTLSAGGTILYHNRRFSELLGMAGKLPAALFEDIVAPGSRAAYKTLLEDARKGCRVTGELTLTTRARESIPTFLAINAFPSQGASAFCVVVSDLTEQKQNEKLMAATAALEESKAQLRATLGNIGDAVIAADMELRVAFLNPVAEQLTGWKSDESVGRPLTEVFRIASEHTREPANNPVAQVLKEGSAPGLANCTALIHRDGHRTPIRVSAAPIRDPDGQILGVVVVLHDATERRRAEEQLLAAKLEAECASKANDGFLAVLSHELHTPLASMLGWARVLRSPKVDASTSARGLEAIERSLKEQVNLIEYLLAISGRIPGDTGTHGETGTRTKLPE